MEKSIFTLNLLDSKLRKYFKKHADKWDPIENWRWPSVCYTLEHKLAYLEREHYLLGHYTLRGILHDWEKPFLYLYPKMTEEEVQNYHRKISAHHVESKKYCKIEHLIEMYIDWECASLTKPDKPLDAFETLIHFYPNYIDLMLPVCLAFNSISQKVYLHSWHELTKNETYNKEIYGKVIQILKDINEVCYCPKTLEMAKEMYDKKPNIQNIPLPYRFMLLINFINKGNVNYENINKHINNIYTSMSQNAKFDHNSLKKVEHSCDKVKINLYSNTPHQSGQFNMDCE